MAIELIKGGNISLTKEVPNLKKIKIGLGWKESKFQSNGEFDLDVSLFCLEKDEKGPFMAKERDFIYFRNLVSEDESIVHNGDNRTGDSEGDDETIDVDLTKIRNGIKEVSIIVNIYDAITRRQNFGMIEEAYINLYNGENNTVIATYNLTETFSNETSVQFGSLYLYEGEWKFKAVGAGFTVGLEAFIKEYRAEHFLA